MAETIRTACTRDCPDACGILATVEDGRITSLRGDPDHPVTRGFLCYRTSRYLERQYHPERLTVPLLRRGERREPISWDDALDLVAEKLLRIKSESGAAAILPYRSGGSLGMLKPATDAFFAAFGPTSVKAGDICSGAGEAAQEADFGHWESHDLFDLRNSRAIVVWGRNLHVSNLHLLPLVREAKARGASVAVVDPVRHRTFELADVALQPRPGGDIALALGVALRLFESGAADPRAPERCDGLPEFRALCASRTLEGWAAAADVPVHGLAALADLYARRPAALLVGWGLQRRARGSATVRALDALGAVSGNLGVPGGGVWFSAKRRRAFDWTWAPGMDLGAPPPPRKLLEPLLGKEILEASDPAIRMVWVACANPVAMLPDSNTVARALASREMTVVVDSFLTDTARVAHLVLPTTTMLEEPDLVGSYGHHWLSEVRRVVPPPEGARTDLDIVRDLAARVGLGPEFELEAEEIQRRLLGKVAGLGASLEALHRGPVRNPLADTVLYADGKVHTPSGRVNLMRELDPDPPPPPPDRPLFLMPVSTEKAQSSQWAREPAEGPATATVHPDAAPGFRDGQVVTLESEIGAMRVRLRLDARQRRDVCLMAKGGWLSRGQCANALVPARATDAGGGACYYDTPVRIAGTGT
jgi:anaerobic selenocysteine-containing dehydrogenase